VIEQITYLIFIKRLDEMQGLEERKATSDEIARVLDIEVQIIDPRGGRADCRRAFSFS
jgi:hypothetical protein